MHGVASRAVKTEAVVLRSMRYGEADRILHLYTPDRGRVSAIAKGVRRARSRFGGRLEPFFRLRIELHEGRSELLTVTGAQTRRRPRRACAATPARSTPPRARATRWGACSRPPSPIRACSTCCAASCRCSTSTPAQRRRRRGAPSSAGRRALAFRLKLLLAAGLAPQLGACAGCGEREHLVGFSGAAGGVVCAACEAASFPLGEDAYRFMAEALGRPLEEAPDAPEPALAQVERAISATLEHHAHMRLMPASRARLSRGGA